MRLRIGILDVTAATILLFLVLLPARASRVERAYQADDESLRAIALAQARLAVDPGNADAAVELAELLTATGQTDWAVQVAGEASRHTSTASWRSLLAISTAHAERIEVVPAHQYARRALEACEALGIGPDRCSSPEHARLSLYFEQLEAGVRSGIDPRADPSGFQNAVLRAVRMVRFRGGTPRDDGQGGEREDEAEREDDERPDDDDGGGGERGDDHSERGSGPP